jgi:hypothetical protein
METEAALGTFENPYRGRSVQNTVGSESEQLGEFRVKTTELYFDHHIRSRKVLKIFRTQNIHVINHHQFL